MPLGHVLADLASKAIKFWPKIIDGEFVWAQFICASAMSSKALEFVIGDEITISIRSSDSGFRSGRNRSRSPRVTVIVNQSGPSLAGRHTRSGEKEIQQSAREPPRPVGPAPPSPEYDLEEQSVGRDSLFGSDSDEYIPEVADPARVHGLPVLHPVEVTPAASDSVKTEGTRWKNKSEEQELLELLTKMEEAGEVAPVPAASKVTPAASDSEVTPSAPIPGKQVTQFPFVPFSTSFKGEVDFTTPRSAVLCMQLWSDMHDVEREFRILRSRGFRSIKFRLEHEQKTRVCTPHHPWGLAFDGLDQNDLVQFVNKLAMHFADGEKDEKAYHPKGKAYYSLDFPLKPKKWTWADFRCLSCFRVGPRAVQEVKEESENGSKRTAFFTQCSRVRQDDGEPIPCSLTSDCTCGSFRKFWKLYKSLADRQ